MIFHNFWCYCTDSSFLCYHKTPTFTKYQFLAPEKLLGPREVTHYQEIARQREATTQSTIMISEPALANSTTTYTTATPNLNKPADLTLATILILCSVVGLPGNIVSFIYFWGKRNQSYPDLLYTIISAVDSCTCAIIFPMIFPLFRDMREASLFASPPFCGIWIAMFFFLLRFSQFMVVVISVTRAISMRAPFYQIKKRSLMIVCFAYAVFLLTLEALFSGTNVVVYTYIRQIVSCATVSSEDGWRYLVLVILNLSLVILISTTVFTSFILTVTTLLKGTRTGNKDFRRVSITISIFTAVFLLCNLPLFIAELGQNVFTWIEYYAGLEDPFVSWYGFFFGYRFGTALNAALNPCLYFCFMPKFRIWIGETIYRAKNSNGSFAKTFLTRDKNDFSMENRSNSNNAKRPSYSLNGNAYR